MGLFESAGSGGYLPRCDARPDLLGAVGLVATKCVIDEQPVGHGLCSFVWQYLVHQVSRSA
eukprot:1831603-Prymnesium_polylepis.1